MSCKNCSNTLNQNDDYCNNCGAKVIRHRLTVRNLIKDITEQYFNVDNKFLQTFLDLFKKPEIVIGSYINGTRKKYVNVISYFAIALTFLGLQLFAIRHFFPEILDFTSFQDSGTAEFQKKNMDLMMEYQSFIMMLYVPLYALISKIVFFNIKTFNYTEHLVIFMYILSQTSIYGTVLTIICCFFEIPFEFLGLVIILPLQIIYISYCFIRLFKLSFKQFLFRLLLFVIVGGIGFIVFSILYAVVLYLTGDLQNLIEAQKAAIEAAKTSG